MDDRSIHDITDLVLMTLCVWREARGETPACRLAVACSIMERVHTPGWWGHDIQSVVTKPWQYSSMTATHDTQLTRYAVTNDLGWAACMRLVSDAINGTAANPAPGADSYYDVSIEAPKWAEGGRFVRQIGRIRFYAIGLGHEMQKKGPAS